MEINNFDITLRLAELDDASFIVDLRNDEKKSRFISQSTSDESQQKEWLRGYKLRESQGLEYYFIAEDKNSNPFATYRVYNINENTVDIGSWITVPGWKFPLDAIKVDFLVKDFVFNKLNYGVLKFDVRKLNKSVINYHKKYNPTIIDEDENNFYFELTKQNFQETRAQFEKLFNKIKN